MSRIKLNLKQLAFTEKTDKARDIVSALRGNPSFAAPIPSLDTVTTAIDACDAAFAASRAARQEVKTRNSELEAKHEVLDQLLNQLAAYVESVAGVDESLIHSAGMDTKATASPSSVPLAPTSLSAATGNHDGEINLSWDKVANAKSYLIEKSPDPLTDEGWAHAGVATKASTTINGLTRHTKFWFRVAAVGARGQSGWSDPATRIAP
jgi:hypothetical protein